MRLSITKAMKIFLTRDSKRFKYHEVFGSTSDFLPTLFVDAGHMDIEPPGSVACTCFTADNIISAITGKSYDHNWLYTQIVQAGKATSSGTTPQVAFSIAIEGVKVVPTGEIEHPVVAYFQTDEGESDFFTNVKSAIQLEYNKGFKRPNGIGSKFYQEWLNIPAEGVLPIGVTMVTDHEWEVCGWDDTTHPDMFRINDWRGNYYWMPRNVFNAAMDDTYGSVALTFAQTTQEQIDFLKAKEISLITRAIDTAFNIWSKLKARFNTPPSSGFPPPFPSKITAWANAIKVAEGNAPYLNNPGSLKVSTLTQSWGAQNGVQASDGGWIAKFATYQLGFTALCNFLKLGAENELLAFHQARTLEAFTKVYAGNPPQGYIDTIAKQLNCSLDVDVSTFLT